MKLSVSPDLSSTRRLLLAAFAVAGVLSVLFALKLDVRSHLGDTDDAMRLVMVRDLLAGHGWYDQWVSRLNPPAGLYMHWSRLVDGGIASLISILRLAAPAVTAEWLARVIWPLLWIFPAVASALWLARNLGARSAVFTTAVLLVVDLESYRQFLPGRIDHHNIQIVMTLIALAAATSPRRPIACAVIAGGASAVGMAVGLEGLVVQALIGASWGIRLAFDRRQAAPCAAYGATLAAGAAALFMIQTPPWRWDVAVCDALALNLVLALVIAGLGLCAVAGLASRLSPAGRLATVGVVGAVAASVYLALDPACLHGPFAAVEPLAHKLWLDTVEEIQPLPVVFKLDRASAIDGIATMLTTLAGAAYLLARRSTRTPQTALAVLALLLSCILAARFWRTLDYVAWIGIPLVGGALSNIAARRLRDLFVPTLAISILVSPMSVAVAANSAGKAFMPRQSRSWVRNSDRCFAPEAYRQLAALPTGTVMSEIDMGSFILAITPHKALIAPYHRISHEIVLTLQAFDTPVGPAEAKVRALGATYIVDCRGLSLTTRPGTLGASLRSGAAPTWLRPLSPPGTALSIWQVAANGDGLNPRIGASVATDVASLSINPGRGSETQISRIYRIMSSRRRTRYTLPRWFCRRGTLQCIIQEN
jgi:hypothetical protein